MKLSGALRVFSIVFLLCGPSLAQGETCGFDAATCEGAVYPTVTDTIKNAVFAKCTAPTGSSPAELCPSKCTYFSCLAALNESAFSDFGFAGMSDAVRYRTWYVCDETKKLGTGECAGQTLQPASPAPAPQENSANGQTPSSPPAETQDSSPAASNAEISTVCRAVPAHNCKAGLPCKFKSLAGFEDACPSGFNLNEKGFCECCATGKYFDRTEKKCLKDSKRSQSRFSSSSRSNVVDKPDGEKCRKDEQCDSGVCNKATRSCGYSDPGSNCKVDGDCAGKLRCNTGTRPRSCGRSLAEGPCRDSADCLRGSCVNKRCVADPTSDKFARVGELCLLSNDCNIRQGGDPLECHQGRCRRVPAPPCPAPDKLDDQGISDAAYNAFFISQGLANPELLYRDWGIAYTLDETGYPFAIDTSIRCGPLKGRDSAEYLKTAVLAQQLNLKYCYVQSKSIGLRDKLCSSSKPTNSEIPGIKETLAKIKEDVDAYLSGAAEVAFTRSDEVENALYLAYLLEKKLNDLLRIPNTAGIEFPGNSTLHNHFPVLIEKIENSGAPQDPCTIPAPDARCRCQNLCKDANVCRSVGANEIKSEGQCACIPPAIRNESGQCRVPCTPAQCAPGQCSANPISDGCGRTIQCGCSPGQRCSSQGKCEEIPPQACSDSQPCKSGEICTCRGLNSPGVGFCVKAAVLPSGGFGNIALGEKCCVHQECQGGSGGGNACHGGVGPGEPVRKSGVCAAGNPP